MKVSSDSKHPCHVPPEVGRHLEVRLDGKKIEQVLEASEEEGRAIVILGSPKINSAGELDITVLYGRVEIFAMPGEWQGFCKDHPVRQSLEMFKMAGADAMAAVRRLCR